jgi:hypothetical protein
MIFLKIASVFIKKLKKVKNIFANQKTAVKSP